MLKKSRLLTRPTPERQDVPSARARVFQCSLHLFKGVAKAALYCAHRTSTVSPCAFCEQEGHLAAPRSSPLAVPPSNPYTDEVAIQPGLNSPA